MLGEKVDTRNYRINIHRIKFYLLDNAAAFLNTYALVSDLPGA